MNKLRQWFLNRFIRSKTVEILQTEYNYLEVVERGNRTVLNSRHTNYSYGGLHKVFRQAFGASGFSMNKISKVLILGFGAGSVATILHDEMRCPCFITGIEVDPEVIHIAKKHFGVCESDRLKIINDDAAIWVARCKEPFDLIVVDLFIDHKIPEYFDTKAFLIHIKKLLTPEGIVYFNRLCYDYDSKMRTVIFEKRFREIFPVTEKIEIKRYSNNIVFTGTLKEVALGEL